MTTDSLKQICRNFPTAYSFNFTLILSLKSQTQGKFKYALFLHSKGNLSTAALSMNINFSRVSLAKKGFPRTN